MVTNLSTNLSLLSTAQIHQALVAFEIILGLLWQSWRVVPSLLIGHSLGEYSALCISGVLSINDTLWLVGQRATMIEKACTKRTHGMLLIPDSEDRIVPLMSITPSCEVACLNGPRSVVVSGPLTQLQSLKAASERGGSFLNVDYAFIHLNSTRS